MNLRTWGLVMTLLAATWTIAATSLGQTPSNDWTRELQLDPGKVLGHDACNKCHVSEIRTWLETPHFTTFETLHRRNEAKQIAERLGLASIKRNDTCIRCHYTMQDQGGHAKPVAGVSCESCHGAARDWLDIHYDYGGPNVNRNDESPAHREKRRQESIAHGMRNPVNLYLVARSCLNCHTVPDERLVNVGGHPAGSTDFELVAWSQGRVRHNFVRSDGKVNEPASRERLRVMYIVGLLADLEYSLRATALATEKAEFGVTSARRAFNRLQQLQVIQQQLSDPFLAQALEAARKAKLRLGNRDELVIAADEVGSAAYAFAQKADGSRLQAVDALLPDPATYK